MALRLTLALLMLAVTIVVGGRRVGWLTRLIRSGQPAPGASTASASACGPSWSRCSGSAGC